MLLSACDSQQCSRHLPSFAPAHCVQGDRWSLACHHSIRKISHIQVYNQPVIQKNLGCHCTVLHFYFCKFLWCWVQHIVFACTLLIPGVRTCTFLNPPTGSPLKFQRQAGCTIQYFKMWEQIPLTSVYDSVTILSIFFHLSLLIHMNILLKISSIVLS